MVNKNCIVNGTVIIGIFINAPTAINAVNIAVSVSFFILSFDLKRDTFIAFLCKVS